MEKINYKDQDIDDLEQVLNEGKTNVILNYIFHSDLINKTRKETI